MRHDQGRTIGKGKTKKQLLSELEELRERIAGFTEKPDWYELPASPSSLLASIVGSSDDAIISKTLDGTITSWNRGAERIYGYAASEAVGRHISMLLPPDCPDELTGILLRIKNGEHVNHFNTTRLRKDSTRIEVSLSISPIIENGRIIGASTIARDISGQKRAERTLMENQRFLTTLISNLPGMIYRCRNNHEWTMEYVSDGCMELTGYRPSDLVMDSKISYNELIHPEDRQRVWSDIQNAITNNQPYQLVYRINAADGCEKWVWEQGRAVPDLKGDAILLEGFITDITDRIEAERKLEDAKLQAEMYVDLMGHDINNMNQVAMGFIELALDKLARNGQLGIEDRILLEKPYETLKNNSRLIDNVRKIKREKSGEVKPMIIDLGNMLEAVKAQYSDISSRDITISCVCPGECYVLANELLMDVFMNLVGNAIKHSTGPLSISIRLDRAMRRKMPYYRISVEDNGPGIPDDMKKNLLDQACLKRALKSGKGFGLCLIKTLLDDFGGIIWVENAVPNDYTKGSRFVVLLPAVEK